MRLDWLTPEWWFGLADYSAKLVLIVGAIAVSQIALSAPRVTFNVNEAFGQSFSPLEPAVVTPESADLLDAFQVTVTSSGGTDVRDIVITPRLDVYRPEPPGGDHIQLLRPGETGTVLFVVNDLADAPPTGPSVFDGALQVNVDYPILVSDMATVDFNHDLAPNAASWISLSRSLSSSSSLEQ